MKRSNQSQSIGNLFAGEIFGIHREPTVETPTVVLPSNHGKITVKPRSTDAVFMDAIPENRTIAVHPYITTEAFAMTMDNYRKYIAKYNERIVELNREIDHYNTKMVSELTEVQQAFLPVFYKKNGDAKTIKFNELAKEFNDQYGMLVKLRKFPTVKYATQLVFQQMLYVYSVQLAKKTSTYMSLGVVTPKPLQGADLNAYKITAMKRDGEIALDICRQTLRNHRARLAEAGVLLDYEFKGSKKGVRMTINEQILVVFDSNFNTFSNAENQALTGGASKELPHINEATGTFTGTVKNNINKRKTVPDFSNKERSAVASLVILQEHLEANSQNSNAPDAESVKVSDNLSLKLLENIIHPQELAENLADGIYNGYTPIDIRELHREAAYGTLTREEFKELIINDFFKTAAKYWRNHNVYIGAWKKAINAYMEKLFFTNNGNNTFLYNKQLMTDKLVEFRWRLRNSEKFYQKTGIKRLFPNDYFDFSRKSKQEIGFEYTAVHYKNHLKYLESKPQKDKKAVKNAEMRAKRINHSKKYDAIIKRFFNNRIGFNELYTYVQDNLPANYLEQLTSVLLKSSENHTKH